MREATSAKRLAREARKMMVLDSVRKALMKMKDEKDECREDRHGGSGAFNGNERVDLGAAQDHDGGSVFFAEAALSGKKKCLCNCEVT